MVDGVEGQDRLFRGRVQGDQHLSRAKQGRLSRTDFEGHSAILAQPLPKPVLNGPIDHGSVGGAPRGGAANGDGVLHDVDRGTRQFRLDPKHRLFVGIDVDGVIELDEEGGQRRAFIRVPGAPVVHDPQRCIGAKIVGLRFRGDQRPFSRGCARTDGDRDRGVRR